MPTHGASGASGFDDRFIPARSAPSFHPGDAVALVLEDDERVPAAPFALSLPGRRMHTRCGIRRGCGTSVVPPKVVAA
jgi:hypothetical protein